VLSSIPLGGATRVRVFLLGQLALVLACATPKDEALPGPGAEERPEPVEVFDPACYTCHGNSLSPAPPRAVGGGSELGERGVGAHRSHLEQTSTWHAAVTCDSCHIVPTELDSPGHIEDDDGTAELFFGLRAWTGMQELGLVPHIDESGRCQNIYCHGASLSGGSLGTPLWTQVDGSQKECGTCHGAPPPAPHPASTDCGSCHPTMQPGTDQFINPAAHINGVVDVSDGQACDSCHGSDAVSAPPRDLAGNMDRASPGVGAHRQHLGVSDWRRELTCSNCHAVPTRVDSPGHVDGDDVAEVPFDVLNPAGDFDHASGSCSNLYCHGNGKGSNGTARWTSTNAMDCGSCHGAPPPPPHTSSTDCGACHPTMIAGTDQFRDPDKHLNGIVELSDNANACDSCHGSAGLSAPPRDLAGNTARSARGVGAHRQHLGGSTWRRAIDCQNCHKVPASVDDPGHLDGDSIAEVPFDSLNPAATVDLANGSCQNLYCHSNGRGSLGSMSWTSTTKMDCGSCHGAPPPAPHPASTDCGSCHPSMAAGTDTFVDASLHINGRVEVDESGLACDSCHGSGGVSAPPTDLAGNSNRSSAGVGAHRQHLASSPWRSDITCQNCHIIPDGVSSPGHIDGDNVPEVPFDDLNPSATVSFSQDTCQNLYCHSNGRGTLGSLSWTSTTAMQCSSCHGSPPPAPHPSSSDCGACHPTMQAGTDSFRDKSLHINGIVEVTGDVACDACHGSGGNAAPPRDIAGSNSRSSAGVGAHRQHLGSSSWRSAITCQNCHKVPSAVDSAGHLDGDDVAEVPFDDLNPAATVNFGNSTCQNLYCHSNGRGTLGSLSWTSTSPMSCDSCHGDPPPAPHPPGTDCGSCHPTMSAGTNNFKDPTLHINGIVEVDSKNLACDACHGSGGDPSPPTDLSGSSSRSSAGVGAHRQHLGASSWRATMRCENCHKVPASVDAPGHLGSDNVAEVPFDSLNPTATVNFTAATCGNLWCHGNGRGNNGSASWTSTTKMTCTSCHSMSKNSLSGSHRDHSHACSECHQTVIDSGQNIIAPGLHVNGARNVSMRRGGTFDPSTRRCTNLACHGTETW